MLAATARPTSSLTDRLGIAASLLCAIHCAAAPVILLGFPALAVWWSSPVVHVLGALLVVPLALVGLHFAWRRHRRHWPRTLGWTGCSLILLALLPWVGELPPLAWNQGHDQAAACASTSCCPTITWTAAGAAVSLPWPTILTLVGSLLLVAAHGVNACCRRRSCCCSAETTTTADTDQEARGICSSSP